MIQLNKTSSSATYAASDDSVIASELNSVIVTLNSISSAIVAKAANPNSVTWDYATVNGITWDSLNSTTWNDLAATA